MLVHMTAEAILTPKLCFARWTVELWASDMFVHKVSADSKLDHSAAESAEVPTINLAHLVSKQHLNVLHSVQGI